MQLCIIVALFSIAFTQILIADNDGKLIKISDFHLKGNASRKHHGTISITITNKSPEGNDYLIGVGNCVFHNVTKKGSKQVIKVGINPGLEGGGTFVRVAASGTQEHLLVGEQMYRFDMKIPDEYKDSQIDSIELELSLCKTPITTKKISWFKSTVELTLSSTPEAIPVK
jgi:hypothetical protein